MFVVLYIIGGCAFVGAGFFQVKLLWVAITTGNLGRLFTNPFYDREQTKRFLACAVLVFIGSFAFIAGRELGGPTP